MVAPVLHLNERPHAASELAHQMRRGFPHRHDVIDPDFFLAGNRDWSGHGAAMLTAVATGPEAQKLLSQARQIAKTPIQSTAPQTRERLSALRNHLGKSKPPS